MKPLPPVTSTFMLTALLAVVLCVLCKRVVLLWYCRVEMNATFDVGCKSEETAVNCTRSLFVYGANIPCAKFLHWR